MRISPLGGWLVSALLIPVGEPGSIPLLTLTLTTITSMQLQNKQTSKPLHVHTNMQPPSKITVCKMYSSQCRLGNNNKKLALATKYLNSFLLQSADIGYFRLPVSAHLLVCLFNPSLLKKKWKFSSNIRKYCRDREQSQIWLTVSSYMANKLQWFLNLRYWSMGGET